MPALEVVDLIEDAVLWAFRKHDSRGDPVFEEPVPIKVRWLQSVTEALENQAGPVFTNGTVFVDRKIVTGSVLWKGKFEELEDNPNPAGLSEVVDYSETPDDKARNFRRSVVVQRYKERLPE